MSSRLAATTLALKLFTRGSSRPEKGTIMALSSFFTYGSLRSYKFSWEKTAASAPANVWEVENAVSWGTERESSVGSRGPV